MDCWRSLRNSARPLLLRMFKITVNTGWMSRFAPSGFPPVSYTHLLKALLEQNGFEADAACDGKTGEYYAALGIYDLLILDVMMPERDGYEVARRLRERRMEMPILMPVSYTHLDVYKRQPVINLSSAEYSKAVSRYLRAEDVFITCDFLEFKHGKWCMPATHAKMARGKMARFIVKNRLTAPEQLSLFKEDGYCFSPELSTSSRYVFSRS